ncbi:MAG: PASTA domain-containing protein [Nitrospirae bacterium]|nr:PASTA domain-containing protein [Nitrospirota bacterium]
MNRIFSASIYILSIAFIGIGAGLLTVRVLSCSKSFEAPDLRELGMVAATDLLRSKGLYIRLEGEDYDSHIPQGHIIRQDVPPKSMVKEGREIKVIVSKGPRIQYVPDVVGKSIEEAEAALKERGIVISSMLYAHTDTDEKNTVIAQRPEPTEKGGDTFSVIVSLGKFQ